MMKLSQHSKNKLNETFTKWKVDRDFGEPMFNYLIYGWEPGSCFTAVLANDFFRAMQSSHPANSVTAFKNLTGWICDTVPRVAYGSYDAVKHWVELQPETRRLILETHDLIYTEKEETWLALKGEAAPDPILW